MKVKQIIAEAENTDEITKNNLLTQFHTLLTQLIQLKTPTSESVKPKSLAESLKLVEADQNNQAEIAKIISQLDGLLQQLQPYSSDPAVQSAIAQYNKVKSANYSMAQSYKGSFSKEKFERFKQLLDKLEGSAKPSQEGSSKPSPESPQDDLVDKYKQFFDIQD